MVKKYNKLVRDLIPEIIRDSGKKCETEMTNMENKIELLENKLLEEVDEYFKEKNLEELADIMEVLFAIAIEQGFSEKELIEARNNKLRKCGGFKKGFILKEVR